MLELTANGLALLKQRKPVKLTKPVTAPEPKVHRAGEIACDEVLFDRLRQLRKQLADERDVPAYIVFSDVSLRQMARDYPAERTRVRPHRRRGRKETARVRRRFSRRNCRASADHPRQIFADDSFVAPAPPAGSGLGDSARDTVRRFRAGRSVEQIARERNLVTSTIYSHLAEAIEGGEPAELGRFFTAEERRRVAAAFEKLGSGSLGRVFESLGGAIDHGRLRIFRAASNAGA